MDIFSHRQLIKTNNGYTLVLYVDRHSSEFAEDFFGTLGTKGKELPKDTLNYIKKYISKNYKGIKIDTVNIMLGSLLVASIALTPISVIAPSLPAAKHSSPKTNTGYPVKPVAPKPAAPKPAAPEPPAIVKTDILLVNKSHSLPEGYVPKNLTAPKVHKVSSAKTMMVPEAAKALEALFTKAGKDGIQLYAVSGYRSFELQDSIFTSNTRKYGSAAAANQFSARPGQSEHQTGLAMDVSSPSVNLKLTQSYAQTREGKWLKENAAQFGFIVRYPKGKEGVTGYQFEPWHIRYVGKSAALEITSRNITLEEYLGKS